METYILVRMWSLYEILSKTFRFIILLVRMWALYEILSKTFRFMITIN